MVSQLLRYERIETTVAKAKELKRLADKVVTIAKEASPAVAIASKCSLIFSKLKDTFSDLPPYIAGQFTCQAKSCRNRARR